MDWNEKLKQNEKEKDPEKGGQTLSKYNEFLKIRSFDQEKTL